MKKIRLYKGWEEANFIERKNRFTLTLKKGDRVFDAYFPNTGRLEEFTVEGGTFFVTPFSTKKFQYRVTSSFYQGSYILIDTIKTNEVVYILLRNDLLHGLGKIKNIYPEKPNDGERFDFFIHRENAPPLILEVKTCTLCHNGVALFPDAPSKRALSHLESLAKLKDEGYDTSMAIFIPNKKARSFIPNFHTDLDFSIKLLSENRVDFKAFKVTLLDPITIDLDSVEEVKIDYRRAKTHCTPKGSYVLVLKNPCDRYIDVGKMGAIFFKKGYYVYVGSGMKDLEKRVKRHQRKNKKKFWHIDYITPDYMAIEKIYTIRRANRVETKIGNRLVKLCSDYIEGFGAGDTEDPSHLFYFEKPPYRNRLFINVLLDYKTFTR